MQISTRREGQCGPVMITVKDVQVGSDPLVSRLSMRIYHDKQPPKKAYGIDPAKIGREIAVADVTYGTLPIAPGSGVVSLGLDMLRRDTREKRSLEPCEPRVSRAVSSCAS